MAALRKTPKEEAIRLAQYELDLINLGNGDAEHEQSGARGARLVGRGGQCGQGRVLRGRPGGEVGRLGLSLIHI